MGVEIELWDIMRSISNWKTLMLIYWYMDTNLNDDSMQLHDDNA
jgi:hypothetical protein